MGAENDGVVPRLLYIQHPLQHKSFSGNSLNNLHIFFFSFLFQFLISQYFSFAPWKGTIFENYSNRRKLLTHFITLESFIHSWTCLPIAVRILLHIWNRLPAKLCKPGNKAKSAVWAQWVSNHFSCFLPLCWRINSWLEVKIISANW